MVAHNVGVARNQPLCPAATVEASLVAQIWAWHRGACGPPCTPTEECAHRQPPTCGPRVRPRGVSAGWQGTLGQFACGRIVVRLVDIACIAVYTALHRHLNTTATPAVAGVWEGAIVTEKRPHIVLIHCLPCADIRGTVQSEPPGGRMHPWAACYFP